MQTNELIKVVIIGAESTGKSTLCSMLAAHYQTVWCPEYAREYLTKNGKDYTCEDLVTIAKGQLALIEKYKKKCVEKFNNTSRENRPAGHLNSPLLFIDTDMYVMKVWSEFVFGKVDAFITDAIKKQQTDLYLLCNIDLPWQKDELREYPDVESRQQLMNIYTNILQNQLVPWIQVNGSDLARLEIAIKSIDLFLRNRF